MYVNEGCVVWEWDRGRGELFKSGLWAIAGYVWFGNLCRCRGWSELAVMLFVEFLTSDMDVWVRPVVRGFRVCCLL